MHSCHPLKVQDRSQHERRSRTPPVAMRVVTLAYAVQDLPAEPRLEGVRPTTDNADFKAMFDTVSSVPATCATWKMTTSISTVSTAPLRRMDDTALEVRRGRAARQLNQVQQAVLVNLSNLAMGGPTHDDATRTKCTSHRAATGLRRCDVQHLQIHGIGRPACSP